MFNFNPYGAAEYGMVAELHRQVQRESEEKVAEPRRGTARGRQTRNTMER